MPSFDDHIEMTHYFTACTFTTIMNRIKFYGKICPKLRHSPFKCDDYGVQLTVLHAHTSTICDTPKIIDIMKIWVSVKCINMTLFHCRCSILWLQEMDCDLNNEITMIWSTFHGKIVIKIIIGIFTLEISIDWILTVNCQCQYIRRQIWFIVYKSFHTFIYCLFVWNRKKSSLRGGFYDLANKTLNAKETDIRLVDAFLLFFFVWCGNVPVFVHQFHLKQYTLLLWSIF